MTIYQLIQITTVVVGCAGALLVGLLLQRALRTRLLPTRMGNIDADKWPNLFRFGICVGCLAIAILCGAALSAAALLVTGEPHTPVGLRIPANFATSRLPWMLAGAAMAAVVLIVFAAIRRRSRRR